MSPEILFKLGVIYGRVESAVNAWERYRVDYGLDSPVTQDADDGE